jgi:hypothetical protein
MPALVVASIGDAIERVSVYERDTGKQASNRTGQESPALSDRVEYFPGADWHRPGF